MISNQRVCVARSCAVSTPHPQGALRYLSDLLGLCSDSVVHSIAKAPWWSTKYKVGRVVPVFVVPLSHNAIGLLEGGGDMWPDDPAHFPQGKE